MDLQPDTGALGVSSCVSDERAREGEEKETYEPLVVLLSCLELAFAG